MELRDKGKLFIPKKQLSGWLVCLLVFLPFTFGTLHQLLALPKFVYYSMDVVLVALVFIVISKRRIFLDKKMTFLAVYVTFFILYTMITYIFNFQSIFYYLWGARNNFRYYVAFFAFAFILTEDECEDYLKAFDMLFYINAIVTVFQFIVLGLKQDNLGGIFGTEKGCNAYSILFFCIIITKSLIWCINHKESVLLCVSKCIIALAVSVLAEMKVFFFLFVIISIVVMLVTSFSWRKLVLSVAGVVILVLALILFSKLFPDWVGTFTVEAMYEIASSDSGYTSSGDLNRLNAIPRISTEISDNPLERIFGYGLGNCETSAATFLNTDFYKQHSNLHYTWFHDAFLFLETGIIGVIFCMGFFVVTFVQSLLFKKHRESNIMFCQLAMVVSIIAFFMVIYNSSLRSEAGYMVYFILALPLISRQKGRFINS